MGANGVPVGGYDAVIPTMLSGLPDALIAVVVILVLSASMSTLSSLVLASSSTLTLDFLKDTALKEMDEKQQVRVMRLLIVVFIAISVVLAIVQYRSNVTFIAQLMGVSWGALAGAFPVWPVLERDHPGRLLGQFSVLHCGDDCQYLRAFQFSRSVAVAHQRRGILYAGRPGSGAAGEPVHSQAGPAPGGRGLLLL